MPRFSVVVPVYNAEKYLEECINSVLTQSFSDIELILVDDGSKDGSGHICDRFAACDNRVKVIHQQNQGHITARINGVKIATGEYVLFLDSDDYWFDGFAQTVDKKISMYGCDMLIYRFIRGKNPCCDFFDGEKSEVSKADFFLALIRKAALNSLCIKAIKRTALCHADVSEFASFRNSEDLLLTLKIVDNISTIAYTDDVLYFYRETQGSITHSYNFNGMDEYIRSRAVLRAETERLGFATKENLISFNNAFLWHVSNAALQISQEKSFSAKERKAEYRKITAAPQFAQAVTAYDPQSLTAVKRLRINLLKRHKYTLLYLTDKIRLLINNY